MTNQNYYLSKFMSWFLRHNLENSGIQYDPGGWVRVSDLINYYNINYSNRNSISDCNSHSKSLDREIFLAWTKVETSRDSRGVG